MSPPAVSAVPWVAAAFFAGSATGYECRFDPTSASAWSACGGTFTTNGLADGSHTLEVRAHDAANNIGIPASRTFVVSAADPDTVILPTPPSVVGTSTTSFSFTASEQATFECRVDPIDTSGWAACTSPYLVGPLADGSHTFEVRATDVYGNVDPTPASWTWTIDTTAPTVSLVAKPDDPTTSTSATFSWTADDSYASSSCLLDAGTYAGCTTLGSQVYSGLGLGQHTFKVTVTDEFGRVSAPAVYSWTVNAPPVNQPPVAQGSVVTVAQNDPGTAINLTLLASDPDNSISTLSFSITTPPQHGSVVCNPVGSGACTYTPAAHYAGPDSFHWTVTDPGLLSDSAVVSLTVQAAPLTVSVSGASVLEGDSGTTTLSFPVTLSRPTDHDITLAFATSDGTATAGTDYVAVTSSVTIPAGSTSATIPVTVNGDTLVEPDETLTLTASTTSDAVLATPSATGTIINDDVAPSCVPVKAHLSTPSNSTTDGGADFDVDGLGRYGTAGIGGTTTFNPEGSLNAAETVFDSQVYLGGIGFLTDCFDGAPVTVVSQSSTSLVTERTIGTLTVRITQTIVADPHGAHLDQTYLLTNTAAAVRPLTVLRYLDGDLLFDGTLTDGGAATPDGSRLYEYDQSDSPNSPTTYVGMQGSLGGSTAPSHWTIHQYPYQSDIATALGVPAAADGKVQQDDNGDLIVDHPYDVTLTQQWDSSLVAGGSVTFTTTTALGIQTPNRPPTVTGETLSVAEDSTGTNLNVLANDVDPENQALTATLLSAPAHGTATCTPAGVCTYSPSPDYNGPDAYTYRVTDALGASATAQVLVTVTPVNDAPTASDAAAATPAGTQKVIDLASSVADLETGDAQLTITVGTFAGGHATVLGTEVTFTPDPTTTGEVNLPFTVTDRGDPDGCGPLPSTTCDPGSKSASALLRITVGALHTVTAAPSSVTVAEDSGSTSIDVAGLSSDSLAHPLTFAVQAQSAHGTASCAPNGACTYSPAANYNGPDTFTYRADDAHGVTADGVVSLTVVPVNDSPTATDVSASTALVTATDVNLGSAVADLETANADLTVSTGPVPQGTITVTGTTVRFTPNAGVSGDVVIPYVVTDRGDPDNCGLVATSACDPTQKSARASITVTVGSNHPPTANPDAATVQPGHTVVVDVLTNDTDPDSDPLVVTSAAPGTTAHQGTVTCDAATCSFVADPTASGTDTFQYAISDGNGGTATATVTITITDCPDVTPALDAGFITGHRWIECSSLAANAVSSVGPPVLSPVGGTVALLTSGDAGLASTPNTSTSSGTDNGTAARGAFDPSILRVDLDVPAGSQCLAFDFSFQSEEYPEFVASSFNDGFLAELDRSTWSVSGQTLTAPDNFAVGPDGSVVSVNSVFFNAANATTTTGTTYDGATPRLVAQTPITPGAHSLYLSIFDASDGVLDSAALIDHLRTSTTACTAGVADRAPVAVDDHAFAVEDGGAVSVDVSAGDTDPDGDTLTYALKVAPSHGQVSVAADGHWSYTPAPDFNGQDSFDYTVSDGRGLSDTGTVTLDVRPVNDAPTATNAVAGTEHGAAVAVDVSSNVADKETPDSGLTIATSPFSGGIATVSGRVVTVTPDASFVGDLVVPYTVTDRGDPDSCTGVPAVCDAAVLTASGHITVTVLPANAPPAANGTTLTFDEDPASGLGVTLLVSGLTSDPEGDVLAFALGSGASHGQASCTLQGLCAYVPNLNFNGTDSFTYTVNDGHHPAVSATVSLVVRPVNDAPTTSPVLAGTTVDNAVDVPLSADINDVETTDANLAITVGTVVGGTASLSGTTVHFTPAAGFAGTATVTYTVTDRGDPDNCSGPRVTCDSARLSSSNVITIVVQGPPHVLGESLTVDEDSAASAGANQVDVSANDSDPNGDTLTYSMTTVPQHGTAQCTAAGACSYQPAANYNGTDAYGYSVTDGHGGSATGTVTVRVRPVNDAPTAGPGTATTAYRVATSISVAPWVNDLETPRQALGLTVTPIPASQGTLVVDPSSNGGPSFTFTPASGFAGTAVVTYTVTDAGDPSSCTSVNRDLCDLVTRSATNTVTIGVSRLALVQSLIRTSTNTTITTTGLGDNFTLRERLTNSGSAPVASPAVTLKIPASVRLGATKPEPSPSGCTSWSSVTRTLVCPMGPTLAAGASFTRDFTVDIAFNCTIVGNSGNNTLTGTPGKDVLCGGGGNDSITGLGGNDVVYGYGPRSGGILDPGPVTFPVASATGAPGSATSATSTMTVSGTDGADTITTAAGNDTVHGEEGNDVVHAGGGNDNITGGAGNDTLDGGLGNDNINGGAGNDSITGGPSQVTCVTLQIPTATSPACDRDILIGGTGDDKIFGGDDADYILGGSGVDQLEGGLGRDYVDGGPGNDTGTLGGVHGGPARGSKTAAPQDHWNRLYGGAGTDTCSAGPGTGTNNTDYRDPSCEPSTVSTGWPNFLGVSNGQAPRLDRGIL